jgi:predicted DsbA family dithiol-disulfide isomerase
MVNLRIYYDFASPFCWIALEISRRLSMQYELLVEWLPFEVIDYLPERGAMPQNPAFVRRGEDTRARKLAAEYGLEIHLRDRLLNSNLALCAVEYAKGVAAADGNITSSAARIHHALFEAYYRDQRDISDRSVVVDVGRQAGLDANELDAVLRSGSFKPVVAESRLAAHALGVVAVPTWLAGGYGVVGVPALAELERLVTMAQKGQATLVSTGTD